MKKQVRREDGGAAMPELEFQENAQGYPIPGGQLPGLSKRELYAALAMQSLVPLIAEWEREVAPERVAEMACRVADALIAQLRSTRWELIEVDPAAEREP